MENLFVYINKNTDAEDVVRVGIFGQFQSVLIDLSAYDQATFFALRHLTLLRGLVSLLGGCDHQFDAVELVRFGCARIVIDGHDVGFRMQSADLAEHASAGHVVRQAGGTAAHKSRSDSRIR